MPQKKTSTEGSNLDEVIAEALRNRERREKSYREQAMKIFPPICARCGREFSGKKLRELTVHHKDHNHDNNPPDGSNWELLCLYCHDNEHSRDLNSEYYDTPTPGDEEKKPTTTYKAFAGLEALLKQKKITHPTRELADSNTPLFTTENTEGTENILEFLWNCFVISVPPW